MNKNIDVLIAGAGPTGLALACFLSQYNVRFRIIDKSRSASEKSKALVVHARTLELFRQLGIADLAINSGEKLPQVLLHFAGKEIANIPLTINNTEKTPYPFASIIPQDITEKVMIDYLKSKGVEIEWHTALSGIKSEKELHAQLLKSGKEIEVLPKFIIGCDGAHSFVRKHLGVDFVGGKYEQTFILSDAKIDWTFKKKGLMMFLEKSIFAIVLPFNKKDRYRIITLIEENLNNPTFEDLQNHLKANLSFPIEISEPNWTSYYNVHHRCVDKFKVGNIMLAGDAAHVHSPAGGQGMNTGIQDAHNLAWKLGMVISYGFNDKLLDSYHDERWRVAQYLVNGTDRLFKMMTSRNKFLQWMRMNVVMKLAPFFIKFNGLRSFIFGFVSQTRINYEHHLSQHNYVNHKKFKSGQRIPWCPYQDDKGIYIYDHLSINKFTLLYFHFGTIDVDLPRDIEYLKIVEFDGKHNKQMFTFYAIQKSLMILVRPDMHIASVGRNWIEVQKGISH